MCFLCLFPSAKIINGDKIDVQVKHIGVFLQQIYDELLPPARNKRLLISLCHSRSFKNRLLYGKISSVDKRLIGEIIRHKNAFSFEPAVKLVSADGDIFRSRKLCHCVHVDKIIGI